MAITADTQGKHDTAAPPSYAAVVAQSGPSSASQQPRPATRTYSLPGDEQSHLNRPARSQDPHRQYHGSAGNAEAQWFPPTSDREVRSRTRKRFLIAFLWAFAIYTLLGYASSSILVC
ncbi:hypothetical protein QFC19_003583 [Naganishia cerealis]|uniref:Uncharacterized protein n=1 Tax=Naganishia cerealis TaxID=610337 RepID=A0ACC2W1B2_9TREE|nr:hypothetical protein QFC19_003583 [Naganishia cerealis]